MRPSRKTPSSKWNTVEEGHESRRGTAAADAWRTVALRGPVGQGQGRAPLHGPHSLQARLPTRNSLEQVDAQPGLDGVTLAEQQGRGGRHQITQSHAASAW